MVNTNDLVTAVTKFWGDNGRWIVSTFFGLGLAGGGFRMFYKQIWPIHLDVLEAKLLFRQEAAFSASPLMDAIIVLRVLRNSRNDKFLKFVIKVPALDKMIEEDPHLLAVKDVAPENLYINVGTTSGNGQDIKSAIARNPQLIIVISSGWRRNLTKKVRISI